MLPSSSAATKAAARTTTNKYEIMSQTFRNMRTGRW